MKKKITNLTINRRKKDTQHFLMFFTAEWSEQSQTSLNELASYAQFNQISTLIVDATKNSRILKKYNITTIPSVVFFKRGKHILTTTAILQPETYDFFLNNTFN